MTAPESVSLLKIVGAHLSLREPGHTQHVLVHPSPTKEQNVIANELCATLQILNFTSFKFSYPDLFCPLPED